MIYQFDIYVKSFFLILSKNNIMDSILIYWIIPPLRQGYGRAGQPAASLMGIFAIIQNI